MRSNAVKRWVAALLSIGAGAGLGLAGLRMAAPSLPASPLAVGLKIGGQAVPGDGEIGPWLRQRERALRARRVTLTHGDARFETTLGELGVRIDVAGTIAAARAVAHQGTITRRIAEARRARRGEIDVPVAVSLDQEAAAEVLAQWAPSIAKAAVDARIDLAGHAKIPDVPGEALDAAASAHRISQEALALGDDRPVTVRPVTREVSAGVTAAQLDDIDVSKVLGAFETKYAVFKVGRAKNVELAAQKLDGLVIPSGGTMSFNERVGPRTREAGFQEAPEIVGDELTVGIGGGTCQVSGTLHGAALYGGMEILLRKAHTRPSDYTQLGLDATVQYPTVDLKLRNPYRFTVVIHAFMPQPGTLRVEVLGGDEVDHVEYRYGVSHIEPFLRRITEKPFLPAGKFFVKQRGTRGMDVHSIAVIHYRDGRVETRQFFSGYKATPEVYWVAPELDRATLPPLPENAKGVEGQPAPADGSDVYGAG
jgi:vancomycin resistance protein YoaR